MPESPSYPNSGWDRADGVITFDGSPIGTATAPGARLINGQVGPISFLEELPDSPSFERAEQGTIVHRFKCDRETGFAIINVTNRGDILTDSNDIVTRVLSCRYDQQKGDFGILTITAESISFDPPPAEFGVDVVEFNPSLTKHPRYAILPRKTLWKILQLYQSVNPLSGVDWQSQIDSSLTGTAKEAADELITKLRKGIDSFYLAGFKATYSSYTFAPVQINPGGYIEDPTNSAYTDGAQENPTESPIPAEFWSTDGSGDLGTNIFTELASSVNPVLYQNGVAWIRLSDTIIRQRTWYRRTQSWIGAPAGGTITIDGTAYDWLGQWDEDIYSTSADIVYNTSDFQ